MAAATDVAMWDACGGRSSFGQNASDPSVACPAGSYCNFFNEWFWQCQPDGTATAMPDTETVTYPTDCAVSHSQSDVAAAELSGSNGFALLTCVAPSVPHARHMNA